MRGFSGGEPFPALVATVLQRHPPGAGTHAVTETVTTLPTANFGLVGPLHDERKLVEWGTPTGYEGSHSSAI